jgi:hypothetical protein
MAFIHQVFDSGFENVSVYFNLGNSFYKLNNIPDSNFYYEKAKSISPNDEDILTNLIFAKNLRIDKIEILPTTQMINFKLSILKLAFFQAVESKSLFLQYYY